MPAGVGLCSPRISEARKEQCEVSLPCLKDQAVGFSPGERAHVFKHLLIQWQNNPEDHGGDAGQPNVAP